MRSDKLQNYLQKITETKKILERKLYNFQMLFCDVAFWTDEKLLYQAIKCSYMELIILGRLKCIALREQYLPERMYLASNCPWNVETCKSQSIDKIPAEMKKVKVLRSKILLGIFQIRIMWWTEYLARIGEMINEVQNCLLGCSTTSSSRMMEAVRTSETSVDNYFTRQYIPEDNSELHTRHRENLKCHKMINVYDI
jgi:hypothetical protein